jgi:hypothetical protein
MIDDTGVPTKDETPMSRVSQRRNCVGEAELRRAQTQFAQNNNVASENSAFSLVVCVCGHVER